MHSSHAGGLNAGHLDVQGPGDGSSIQSSTLPSNMVTVRGGSPRRAVDSMQTTRYIAILLWQHPPFLLLDYFP